MGCWGGLRTPKDLHFFTLFPVIVPSKQCYCRKNNTLRRVRPPMIYWNDATGRKAHSLAHTAKPGIGTVRTVCLYTSQLSLIRIAPTHGGMARLSWPVELGGWLHTEMVYGTHLPTVTHPTTNRAQRWLIFVDATNDLTNEAKPS